MLSWQFLSATKRGLNDAQLEMIAHRLFGKSCLNFWGFTYFAVNWLDFHLKIISFLQFFLYHWEMLDFKKKISHLITFTFCLIIIYYCCLSLSVEKCVDEFYLNYLDSQQNSVPIDLSD